MPKLTQENLNHQLDLHEAKNTDLTHMDVTMCVLRAIDAPISNLEEVMSFPEEHMTHTTHEENMEIIQYLLEQKGENQKMNDIMDAVIMTWVTQTFARKMRNNQTVSSKNTLKEMLAKEGELWAKFGI